MEVQGVGTAVAHPLVTSSVLPLIRIVELFTMFAARATTLGAGAIAVLQVEIVAMELAITQGTRAVVPVEMLVHMVKCAAMDRATIQLLNAAGS